MKFCEMYKPSGCPECPNRHVCKNSDQEEGTMTHQELNALRTRNIQIAEDAKEALLRLYRERGGDYSTSDKTERTAKMITAFFYLMTSNDAETRVEAHDLYVKYQRSMARAGAFDLVSIDMK